MIYFLIFISAILVNNIVLSQFLGICPFLGVSKKISTAMGMGAAVTFVMALSTLITYLLQMLLDKFGLGFLQTIVFILVIAASVPGVPDNGVTIIIVHYQRLSYTMCTLIQRHFFLEIEFVGDEPLDDV